MRLPLDELRELYANYEHLLAIEKTSKEEAASEAIPKVAMKMIREQGQKLAEFEVKLEEAKVSLVERESRLLHVEHLDGDTERLTIAQVHQATFSRSPYLHKHDPLERVISG